MLPRAPVKADLRDTPPCPQCEKGTGTAVRVTAERATFVVTFQCASCGHDWTDTRVDPDWPRKFAESA